MRGQRGKIVCRDRASQLVDFSKMVFDRGATPTDIDGFVELGGKFFIFFDLKHETAEKIQGGQMWAYENLTKAIHNPNKGKYCITLIAKHNTPTTEDIQAENCLVTDCYFDGKWSSVTKNIKLKSYIDRFIKQPSFATNESLHHQKSLDDLLQTTKP